MKKIIAIILVIVCIMLFTYTLSGCDKNVVQTDSKLEKISITAQEELKILQLTDIHLTGSEYETIEELRAAGFAFGPTSGITAFQRDRWALQTVDELIKDNEPDFVIVTGDIAYTNPYTQILTPVGHTDNLKAVKLFAEQMESYEIPWAAVLGNHDHEGDYSREQIADYLESLEHCVFQKGPDNVTGFGNYSIDILNSDGTYNTTLIMLDSNSYRNPEDHTGSSGYDSIHDDQIVWYESELNAIKTEYSLETLPNSLLFFHIPLTEYKTARDLYFAEVNSSVDNPDVHLYEGIFGEDNNAVCSPKIGEYEDVYYDGGNLFDKIMELNSTKATFVGHDHANNLIMEYKNVQLVYGKSIDYIAYPIPDICKNDNYRGGTMITLKDKTPFVYDNDNKTIELISYDGGLYNQYIADNN